MSSNMFMFDESCYQPVGQNMLSPEISSNFFNDPLYDSSIDTILQEISSNDLNQITKISANEAHSLDQIAHTLLSNSPPSHQLETLSLSQQQQQYTQFPNLSNGLNEVKTEDFNLVFDSCSYNSYFLGGLGTNSSSSYESGENYVKFMQRSYSSNSVETKPGFLFQPSFDALLETHNFTNMGTPEIDASAQMRRACSTGDLPELQMKQREGDGVCTSTSTSTGDGNLTEEANLKVGKYSAEERKERIDRYRAKRTQRNFNKTIKYACRKTLADNRPRVRGRFARNDESGEIPRPTSFNPCYEDEDDLWVDNVHEEDDERILGSRGGQFLTNFGGIHFQYYGFS